MLGRRPRPFCSSSGAPPALFGSSVLFHTCSLASTSTSTSNPSPWLLLASSRTTAGLLSDLPLGPPLLSIPCSSLQSSQLPLFRILVPLPLSLTLFKQWLPLPFSAKRTSSLSLPFSLSVSLLSSNSPLLLLPRLQR